MPSFRTQLVADWSASWKSWPRITAAEPVAGSAPASVVTTIRERETHPVPNSKLFPVRRDVVAIPSGSDRPTSGADLVGGSPPSAANRSCVSSSSGIARASHTIYAMSHPKVNAITNAEATPRV